MGPVELLRNKRSALIRDDEAILLFLLGRGEKRPRDLRDASQMPERTFWRSLSTCHRQRWVASEKSRPIGKAVGRGLKTLVRLTPEGASIVRRMLGGAEQRHETRDQEK